MGTVTVSNKNLDQVTWLGADRCTFSVNNGADLWCITISPNLSIIDSLRTMLSADEIRRAERYYQLKDQNRFIISRAALRFLMGRYLRLPADQIEFGIGVSNKPYLKNKGQHSIEFNLSHSGDRILLAVAATEIGADVELVKKEFDFNGIIDQFFSEVEIDYIREVQSVDRFYKLWTRKEALTKGTGTGLDDDIKIIPGLDGFHSIKSAHTSADQKWVTRSFTIDDVYSASVATASNLEELSFYNFKFLSA